VNTFDTLQYLVRCWWYYGVEFIILISFPNRTSCGLSRPFLCPILFAAYLLTLYFMPARTGVNALAVEKFGCTWATPAAADVQRVMQQFDASLAH
jgi:hypothetical protein